VKRIAIAALIIASVLITALQTGLAGSARADIVAVSLPTQASISSTTLTLAGTARLGSAGAGRQSATLWFHYPDAAAPTRVGSATSRRPGFLAITARIDATRIMPGANQIDVVDSADGTRRTIALDLRRESRVAITHAEFRPHARVALAVRVMHFDPGQNAFVSSQFSPVRLQELVNGSWITLAQVTTDQLGLAGAVLPAGAGMHDYRAVRPDGATVRAATSLTVRSGVGVTATTLLP
jgi:hypothetical protein